MYLINTTSLQLEYFPDERRLRYAILSHCWGSEEVLFKDMTDKNRRDDLKQLSGYDKILQCCRLAKESGLDYAWVDTCCIDKSSSAELQEAINSMFRWYQSAVICFAYLADVGQTAASKKRDSKGRFVKNRTRFRHSKWFRRGWTLQELLAPTQVMFYDGTWSKVGTRTELADTIRDTTGIQLEVLTKTFDPSERFLAAEIMSWARGRETTRIEDRAYSLIGLFDINMPMLYGEGERAFKRLQEEIMRSTFDPSILAWKGIEASERVLFAPSPDNFPAIGHKLFSDRAYTYRRQGFNVVSNEGVSLTMNLLAWTPFTYIGIVGHYRQTSGKRKYIGVYLRLVNDQDYYVRVSYMNNDLVEIPELQLLYSKVLRDLPVNIVHKLSVREIARANSLVMPHQCRILLDDSCIHESEGNFRLYGMAKLSPDRRAIMIKEGCIGTFCKVLPSAWGEDKGTQIQLGLDYRFLPYCIFFPDSAERLVSPRPLARREDWLSWQNSIGASPLPLITLTDLDGSVCEYTYDYGPPGPIGLLVARTRSRMCDVFMDRCNLQHILLVEVQIGPENKRLTFRVWVTMSVDSGWTFRIITV